MRYSKEHKEGVRSQLLSESGSYAKKHGFAATGVDALANAAGLTTGSLYKHFSNKNDLFTAVITAEISRTVQVFENMNPDDMGTILKALASYLSMQHVHSPDTGCLLPSLTAEVARANDDAHLAFEAGMLRFKDVLKEMTGSDTVAWTVIAQNVGAVMIARAMQHESAKEEIINAVRTTGAQLLVEAFEKK
ncbi:TetR/AcrR family transcriptional regulator [Undibacterium sp. RTI2.1]|uniref:TetR/AcrR family transcriptional regulator n=1 Tax=unclassified Undibacterium TaxID=2630295 RepID=UPI002AB56313|nr:MULTISPECIES: TetR/AcrR family transcriptional regulator [unclassified Undibacterium]MDY7540127.1 TetR/AcrR family transcriptional regulator [Undibacterium sp. 5I1]MEB0030300.1 TetR/AcrR family transcriptional regulator [Undibacterium sp. RTI2.1]MEB0115420.1 TetR/AcrR family transcriptional regulator [Undibacterium sp. RTI2.2]MEB0230626.1 TetR/AcrR family transcriptional regulator [Undibacterium sp. 10I3]MEB0257054.1 TetR/AcrR family transcriptional regulator [Undibacterium sp. 5I1]